MNLIYTICINSDNSKCKNSTYSEYSVLSWSKWCKKNNIDFFIIDKNYIDCKFPIWNQFKIFDIIGNNYEKIGYVDSDTIIKWNAPNIFNEYNNEFCGVKDANSLRWTKESLDAYSPFFPNVKLEYDEYINAGVVFFHKNHKHIFDELINLYNNEHEKLDEIKKVGHVQTILNFSLKKSNTIQKYLNDKWNLISMHKKNMFLYNNQLNKDNIPFFIKYSYIWHFTGFPIEYRAQFMGDTWNLIKHNYD